MKVGSLFSGIGAPEVAWTPLGWRFAWHAEIDPFASAVFAHHHSSPNLGDVTGVRWNAVEPVDLLVAGSPCQSFSVAGQRLGLDDPRGNLALITLGIARKLRPRWLVFENVPGILSSNGGRDFGAFLGTLDECGYGWAYRILDAQYFGVPQRRRRVFVVGYLGDWRPPAAVLFEPDSLQGHPPARRAARPQVAGALDAPSGRGSRVGAEDAAGGKLIAGTLDSSDGGADLNDIDRLVTDTLRSHPRPGSNSLGALAFGGNRTTGPIETATALNAHGGPHGRLDFESETFIAHAFDARQRDVCQYGDVAGALDTDPHTQAIAFDLRQITSSANRSRAEPGDPVPTLTHEARPPSLAFTVKDHGQDAGEIAPTLRAMPGRHANAGGQLGAIGPRAGVRRLVPVECERLQGLPDGYTAIPWRRGPGEGVTFEGVVELRGKRLREPITAHCPDGPRYKVIGNSMAVPVLRWLGRRIDAVDALLSDLQPARRRRRG